MPIRLSSTDPWIRAASLALALAASAGAPADVRQFVFTGFESSDGTLDDRDSDEIIVPFGVPITVDLLASVGAPGSGYANRSSAGRFGNVGVSAQQTIGGMLTSQVVVESNENVNVFGRPTRAVANFIIDGGEFSMTAGGPPADPALLEFQLDIISDVSGGDITRWQSGFDLTSVDFTNVDLALFGEDIGAALVPGTSTVEIPLSFQTVDLGIVPPGGVIDLEYFLDIRTDARFVEAIFYEYSDPLAVSGASNEFPLITWLEATSAPAPGTLALLAAGSLLWCPWRRRRRGAGEGATFTPGRPAPTGGASPAAAETDRDP